MAGPDMAIWRRDHTGHPIQHGLINHGDVGSRYTSCHFGTRLIQAHIDAFANP